MKKLKMLSVFVVIFIISCSHKDDEPTQTDNPKQALLCSSQCWKPISKLVDNTNNGINDGTEQVSNYDLDNC